MRILGIDPGTSLIGYGVVDVDGKNYKAVDFGDLKTGVNIRNADRVKTVYDFFDKLIKKYKPDKLALESLFFFKNAKTVIKVSEIRGVLMLTAAKNGIEIAEFTPLQVKQAVASYGRAEKIQVQNMVKLILNLKTVPKPDDAADALAIAICCANSVVY
ncbi:MAG: crossover junction endodeoxyribonuclease RuvC [Candidatus Yanofskybacteria bacterium]|nr:crossover junction endodeoxyribonuclease RuvC [Candidatus Yanofskybacteria bacterium]